MFIGLSVKQSKASTKSNYSVQKILGEKTDSILTEIKKKYLIEKGFPKFNETKRKQVNRLFYPENKENHYMNTLKEEIKNKKDSISAALLDNLFQGIGP